MPANIYRAGLLVPEAQIPSIEILESKPVGYSEIFPDIFEDDLRGDLGDYKSEQDPGPGEPLSDVADSIRKVRRDIVKDTDGEGRLTAGARQLLAATELQRKIMRSISKAHSNLVVDGYSPGITAIVIEHYVNQRDQDRHEFYQSQTGYYQTRIRDLEGAKPEKTEAGGPLDLDMLEMEIARSHADERLELNTNRMARLHFEWLSSTVIISELKDQTSDSDLALAA